MPFRISSRNTLDTLENTGFISGTVLSVNLQSDTADILSGGKICSGIPVFYNCLEASGVRRNGALKNSSKALCRGDEVIIRTHKGEPSHIIGFKDDLWPCISVPAFAFNEGSKVLDNLDKIFFEPSSPLFKERYRIIPLEFCYTPFQVYINEPDADISSGFVSFQTHWTDSKYHRRTEVFYDGVKIYETYNNETFSNVFNGTRSNVLGAFIHPASGWGAFVYQVNTFTDWKPQVSGRVVFDFYLYTSAGFHTKLATAHADITGADVQAQGECAEEVRIYASEDEHYGSFFTGVIRISGAGIFSSNGSTNELPAGDCAKTILMKISEGPEKPEMSLTPLDTDKNGNTLMADGNSVDDEYRIYIKNR